MTQPKSALVGSVVALVLALAGCSSTSGAAPKITSTMSPREIASAASKALGSQQIMKLTGYVEGIGLVGNMAVTMNRARDYSAALAPGHGDLADPAMQVIETGGTSYIKMSSSFVAKYLPTATATPAATHALADALGAKWLIVPSTGRWSHVNTFASLTNSMNIDMLASQFDQVSPGATVGSETSVNGVAAYPVTDQGSTLYVASQSALPIRLAQDGTLNNFDVSYPSSATIAAPSGAVTFQAAMGSALAAAFGASFAAGVSGGIATGSK